MRDRINVRIAKEWGQHYVFVHDAEPDESWDYDEEDIPCLTRKESLPVYSEAIVRLTKVVANAVMP